MARRSQIGLKNYKISTKRKKRDGRTLEIMEGFVISVIGLDKPDTGKYAKCLLVHIHCIVIGFIRLLFPSGV
jgi:hypothetical protein